jgi:hypothetical protein
MGSIPILATKTATAQLLEGFVKPSNKKFGAAKRSRQFSFSLHENQPLTLNRGSFVVLCEVFELLFFSNN